MGALGLGCTDQMCVLAHTMIAHNGAAASESWQEETTYLCNEGLNLDAPFEDQPHTSAPDHLAVHPAVAGRISRVALADLSRRAADIIGRRPSLQHYEPAGGRLLGPLTPLWGTADEATYLGRLRVGEIQAWSQIITVQGMI